MLRYSYNTLLKRTEMELVGLILDLEKVRSQTEKEKIEQLIKKKEKQIEWIKENLWRHPEPFII